LNSNLTGDRSISFAALEATSPEQRAIDAQMEQERRVLDMINRVQMFQIACSKVNDSLRQKKMPRMFDL